MASKRQIDVGGVKIGGGAPVAVQSMTKTETADYDATMRQIHAIAEAGGDLVRCAVPRDDDVRALERIVVESPIPVIADIHFNHTLALKAIDAGAHCIRINPGNIGGAEKVGEVVDKARAAGTPMRIGVNSGSLPKHLHELERESAGGGPGGGGDRARRADGAARLPGLQGLDQVDQRAEHDRLQPPAGAEDRQPAAPGHHRGGHEVVGLAQVRRRAGHPAGRRHRRHDPHLAVDLPRRGGGQGRLGDPQGAQAARARPGADRLPHLRPASVRHGHGGGRDRGAPAPVRRSDRGGGAGLRGQRDRRGLACRLRDHRRQERGPHLRPRQAAAEGAPGPARGRPVRRDRPLDRPRRRARGRARGRRRAPPGSRRSRRRTRAS